MKGKKNALIIFIVLMLLMSGFFIAYLFACEDDWCFIFDWQKSRYLSKLPTQDFLVSTYKNKFNPSPLELENLLDLSVDWTATLAAERVRVITATGDVLPARVVNYKVQEKNIPLWPYEKVAPNLAQKQSDLMFINLETPLVKNCPLTRVGMIFCGDLNNIEGILYLGVNVANLANNHMGNQGEEGLRETISLLNQHGILTTGIDNVVYKEIKGVKFAFLGYNDIDHEENGISWAHEDKIHSDIALAKRQADVVVVAFHWGLEYRSQPDSRQVELGHLAVDAGADLIVGNHPHWIQPIEVYKGKLITYAHGNFVFDQMWSLKTRQGIVGRYIFYDKQLIDAEFLPLQIEDFGQPYFLEGKEREDVLRDFVGESIKLFETITISKYK